MAECRGTWGRGSGREPERECGEESYSPTCVPFPKKRQAGFYGILHRSWLGDSRLPSCTPERHWVDLSKVPESSKGYLLSTVLWNPCGRTHVGVDSGVGTGGYDRDSVRVSCQNTNKSLSLLLFSLYRSVVRVMLFIGGGKFFLFFFLFLFCVWVCVGGVCYRTKNSTPGKGGKVGEKRLGVTQTRPPRVRSTGFSPLRKGTGTARLPILYAHKQEKPSP